jgi:hypothetical protein
MLFRETGLFTRRITSLLSDDEYAALQGVLILQPEAGDLKEEFREKTTVR